jgi:hypothetical protein
MKSQPPFEFMSTRVNLDFERRLHEHTNKKSRQVLKSGDVDEDVMMSFLDDLKRRRLDPTFSRRRNSPQLQSKKQSTCGPQNIVISNADPESAKANNLCTTKSSEFDCH